jgi:TRAP-type C4-dicarboxylate transport system permease large subunit
MGGIAHRLVRLAVALVGWVRGGLGMAVVAAEYIFSGISGSTVADVSAVASTTIPACARRLQQGAGGGGGLAA